MTPKDKLYGAETREVRWQAINRSHLHLLAIGTYTMYTGNVYTRADVPRSKCLSPGLVSTTCASPFQLSSAYSSRLRRFIQPGPHPIRMVSTLNSISDIAAGYQTLSSKISSLLIKQGQFDRVTSTYLTIQILS